MRRLQISYIYPSTCPSEHVEELSSLSNNLLHTFFFLSPQQQMKHHQAISMVFLLMSSAVIARQVRVYAGGNLSTMKYVWTTSDDSIVSSPGANFHYGASYAIQYAEHASFILGLSLEGSSFQIKSKDQPIDLWQVKADLWAISLPMAFRVGTQIGNTYAGHLAYLLCWERN